MTAEDRVPALLSEARLLMSQGRDEEAYAAYLKVLGREPMHHAARHELGALAYGGGYRSAARTLYRLIVQARPDDLIGRVNLGNILYEDGDAAGAEEQFAAALALDPDSIDGHRGLGRILLDRGEATLADMHWRRSFPGQAIAAQPYRGTDRPLPVLLLVSARDGNIPTKDILDYRRFAVTALYAEYYKPELALPAHALIFNAIGDADLCSAALVHAAEIVRRSGAPVINQPARVARSGRAANAARLSVVPDARLPRILELPRDGIAAANSLGFPLLLRAKGFHTGRHFLRVEREGDLATASAQLPGETLLAIEYLDARGTDGLARKYRVMHIGGVLYPLHLAISTDWKVHYFTTGMATNAGQRAEEQRFLENMPNVLGVPAMVALEQIGRTLGLDYCGIDFALAADGALIVFEANATMVMVPPPPDPIWDYRRAPIARAMDAARKLLTGLA